MNGRSESSVRKFLIDHNSILVLVISILIGVLITYLAYDILQTLDIIFLLPIVSFAVMHFLKLKGIKQRLLAGLIIFLVVGIVSAGLTSATYYKEDHPISYSLSNGAQATLKVSPFGGNNQNYNFSLYLTDWPSSSAFSTSLNVSASPTSSVLYNFDKLSYVPMGNGTILVYKNINDLSQGIYSFNFNIANGTSSPIIVGSTGPVNAGSSSLFAFILPGFVILYLIPMEIILLAIVFLARSFDRTRSFRRPPPPEHGDSKQQ